MFIAQMIPFVQSNPSDLTNDLLLRILLNDTSFNGTEPLAPTTVIPTIRMKSQAILFASLGVTLFAAFIAVLGKQWILHYTRASTWGSIADRGKERQIKFWGLKKWGFYLVVESLPVMLQLAFLLFAIGLVVFLWGIEVSAAYVTLTVTCIGCALYAWIVLAATIWEDCPYKTHIPILLRKVLMLRKGTDTLGRLWLRRGRKRWSASLQHLIEPPAGKLSKHNYNFDTFLNPKLWRRDPLFTPILPEDISASAGFWLLENSTDFSAATAVATAFLEFQWPSNHPSTTALVRLRDTYLECCQKKHKSNKSKSTPLKALQCAALYYVLYRTELLHNATRGFEVEVGQFLPELPSDLISDGRLPEMDGKNLFKSLLRVEDRSKPVTSARFLSYIAPFWSCGASDADIRLRHDCLEDIGELIQVLEDSKELKPAALTDCILCVGATMDFPLHPADLIRVDKRCVYSFTLMC